MQFEKEFPAPELLPIKESLIKYVFEPNAAKKDEVRVRQRERMCMCAGRHLMVCGSRCSSLSHGWR